MTTECSSTPTFALTCDCDAIHTALRRTWSGMGSRLMWLCATSIVPKHDWVFEELEGALIDQKPRPRMRIMLRVHRTCVTQSMYNRMCWNYANFECLCKWKWWYEAMDITASTIQYNCNMTAIPTCSVYFAAVASASVCGFNPFCSTSR